MPVKEADIAAALRMRLGCAGPNGARATVRGPFPTVPAQPR